MSADLCGKVTESIRIYGIFTEHDNDIESYFILAGGVTLLVRLFLLSDEFDGFILAVNFECCI